MDLREAKVIADGMVRSSERSAKRIADGIVKASERNAEALLNGFERVASSLSGTKAELMMDCLTREANGGELPKVGSRKWNECRAYTQNILNEFNGKLIKTRQRRRR